MKYLFMVVAILCIVIAAVAADISTVIFIRGYGTGVTNEFEVANYETVKMKGNEIQEKYITFWMLKSEWDEPSQEQIKVRRDVGKFLTGSKKCTYQRITNMYVDVGTTNFGFVPNNNPSQTWRRQGLTPRPTEDTADGGMALGGLLIAFFEDGRRER